MDTSVTDPGKLYAIDMMMLRVARDRFNSVLNNAVRELRYLRDDHLGPLPTAEDLPPEFREAYADLERRLDRYIAAFDDLDGRYGSGCRHGTWADVADRDDMESQWCGNVPADEFPAIDAVVERMNMASRQVRVSLDSLAPHLANMPPSMLAWDNSAEIRCTVSIVPISERPCYQAAEDPLDIDIKRFLLEETLVPRDDDDAEMSTRNWNYYPAGPLAGKHFSYLTYQFIDSGFFGARLLPLIDDIWLEVFVRADGSALRIPNDEGPPSKLPFREVVA